jgi:hypothetical protein
MKRRMGTRRGGKQARGQLLIPDLKNIRIKQKEGNITNINTRN